MPDFGTMSVNEKKAIVAKKANPLHSDPQGFENNPDNSTSR